MKRTINTLFLFLVFSLSLQAHQIVRLSENPWSFCKVESKPINLSPELSRLNLGKKALFDDNYETYLQELSGETEIVIDMGVPRKLSSISMMFDKVCRSATFKLEGSLGLEQSWQTLVDHSAKPVECSFKRVDEMGTIDGTVGFKQRIIFSFVPATVTGTIRYLKLTHVRSFDVQEKPLNSLLNGLDVFVLDENARVSVQDYVDANVDVSKWKTVGIPHCYNENDSYLNCESSPIWKGNTWYRTTFKLDKTTQKKRVYLEFKAIGIAAAVYVNGTFKPGNTKVPQPGNMTHIGCFIPFSVDITDELIFGEENTIAVQISNAQESFFTWPNFGVWEAFGMGWGGIYSDVLLHVVNESHIPGNAFSASNEWGTYNAVASADERRAALVFQTNIKNASTVAKHLTLSVQLLNKEREIVSSADTTVKVESGSVQLVNNHLSVYDPKLWYPNNSQYGKPYLYTVRRIVSEGKVGCDTIEESMGIRTISWDDDYCYVNGKMHFLQGFGHRSMYPALGCAITEELQWKDVAYISACGGNTLRIGHAPPLPGFLEACDHYGVLLFLNSGDNEWSLKNEPALTYKREYDRNVMLAFRNHPSVCVWESNNGLAKDGVIYYPSYTHQMAEKYDSINPRIVMNRDWYPPEWDSKHRIVVGFTNGYTKINGSPSLNTEVYGANWEGRASWCIARSDYDNEKRFTQWYVSNYLADKDNKACGWLDWMLAETQGESYTIYLNGKSKQKSLGSSAMDANRFPKLKYRVYQKALWVPFETQPGVALQSSWDFDYPIQNIDVWSNCPYVEVLVNNRSYGVKDNKSRTKQLTWENIVWEKGCVIARGLDYDRMICTSDTLYSSDAPYAIQLMVEPLLVKPDGKSFTRKANGSDVAIITARVVDKNGHLCTNAAIPIKFDLFGVGEYCGSADFYITEGQPLHYHAPGDKELNSEGGLMRVAIRSTFIPGKVIVKASSEGLITGKCSVIFHNASMLSSQ